MNTPHVTLDITLDEPFPEAPAALAAQLADLAAATLGRFGLTGSYEITVVLTDDATMQRVNRAMRGLDRTTDVLSFPLMERPLLDLPADEAWAEQIIQPVAFVAAPSMARQLGDIMISVPTVLRQARAADHAPWWECCYLFVHAILHLLGYDDATEVGYRAMVAHQEAILRTELMAS